MDIKLENQDIIVNIKSLGAELYGIFNKHTNIQYIWQPGKEIWNHSSLLLFPNPGRICRDRIIVDGKVYPATMHGFLHDSEFEVVDVSECHAILQMRANAQTLSYFPYSFVFKVIFSLDGNKLTERFEISVEDKKTMYFSFGAHPGFYLPLVLGESGDDYILKFDSPQVLTRLHTESGSMLITGEESMYLNNSDTIHLSEHFFDNGPMLLNGVNANSISLISKKSSHYIQLGISGFPYMCLWGNPSRSAVICIEPWCGISDRIDTNHIWEHKQGIQSVEFADTFCRELTFITN